MSISSEAAAASGTLSNTGRSGGTVSGGVSHVISDQNTGSGTIDVTRVGISLDFDYDTYVTLGSVLGT